MPRHIVKTAVPEARGIEHRVEQADHAPLLDQRLRRPELRDALGAVDMRDELVGREGDPVRLRPGDPPPAGLEVGDVALGRRARERHQRA
jgi:hypothetical protein